jgi:hypothetical protein
MTDRLALATHVRKARRGSICTICHVPIIIGQPIARLISPSGWCHVRCVPHVARARRGDGDGDPWETHIGH